MIRATQYIVYRKLNTRKDEEKLQAAVHYTHEKNLEFNKRNMTKKRNGVSACLRILPEPTASFQKR